MVAGVTGVKETPLLPGKRVRIIVGTDLPPSSPIKGVVSGSYSRYVGYLSTGCLLTCLHKDAGEGCSGYRIFVLAFSVSQTCETVCLRTGMDSRK